MIAAPSRQAALLASGSVAGIVIVYSVSLWLLEHRLSAAATMHHTASIPLFYKQAIGAPTEAVLALLALIESLLLYGAYRSFASVERRFGATLMAIGMLILLVVSVQANFISPDAYYYVLYGKAPTLGAAYHSAPLHFAPGFGQLGNVLTERPLLPSVYGPIWQLMDRAMVGPAQTLHEALIAVRVLNVIALLVLFGAVVTLNVPRELRALVVLNPALYYMYVAEAHNDIVPLATIVVGLVLVSRRWVGAAVVCGALAGAMKISLIVIGIAALATRGSLRSRVLAAVGIVLGAIVLSYALAGHPYVAAMVTVGKKQGATGSTHVQHLLRLIVQAGSLLAALAAVCVALLYRRIIAWASFTFPGISGLVHAWYFPWGLPYALGSNQALAPFAIALPAVTFFSSVDEQFNVHLTSIMLLIALALVAWRLVVRRGLIPIEDT